MQHALVASKQGSIHSRRIGRHEFAAARILELMQEEANDRCFLSGSAVTN